MNLLSDDQTAVGDSDTPVYEETSNSAVVVSDESDSVKPDLSDAATREDDEYDSSYEGEPKTVNQNFTYPTHADPARRFGGGTGVYLDDVQRVEAEKVRAKLEGREPDLDNPPAIQGTPLVPTHIVKSQLPGDYVVEADKQLPVVIGTPQDSDDSADEAPVEEDSE